MEARVPKNNELDWALWLIKMVALCPFLLWREDGMVYSFIHKILPECVVFKDEFISIPKYQLKVDIIHGPIPFGLVEITNKM